VFLSFWGEEVAPGDSSTRKDLGLEKMKSRTADLSPASAKLISTPMRRIRPPCCAGRHTERLKPSCALIGAPIAPWRVGPIPAPGGGPVGRPGEWIRLAKPPRPRTVAKHSSDEE